ncbi:MAG: hypothetical protein HFF73_11910 [Oscillospiraceae bacterium]|nr:hypothetical protein [Oscillospiraceae bacterium]
MKKRIVSIITALALCLSLCPAWAFAAEGDASISVLGTLLEADCCYTVSEDGTSITKAEGEAPPDAPYLEYSGGKLIVHGDVSLVGTSNVIFTGALSITGSRDDRLTLECGTSQSSSSLRLEGDVNFTENLSVPLDSHVLTTSDNYGGDITINATGGPAVSGSSPLTIASAGNVTITSVSTTLTCPADITAAGKVTISTTSDSAPAVASWMTIHNSGSVEISGGTGDVPVLAGGQTEITSAGDVTITGSSTVTYIQLTVNAGGNVSITGGNKDGGSPAFPTPANLTVNAVGNITIDDKCPTVNYGAAALTSTGGGTVSFPPVSVATNLDFSDPTTDPGDLDTNGYQWDAANKKLTLKDVQLTGTVTLPDDTVTIETIGKCSVDKLSAGDSPQNTNLTFTGTGELTVRERINLSGGDNNALTVDAGAAVIANGGISIGASGGVNSIVTINGTLTAKGDSDTAISAGKVVVGKGGKLSVSGIRGVQLNGMNSGGSGSDFTGVFTVVRGGSFYANCTEFNVAVYPGADTFPDGSNADKAIIIPEDHMPGDCRVEKGINAVNFIKISTGNVFTGPMTIHEKHTYDSTWKFDSAQHWRECTYEGCSKRDGEASHNPIWQYNTDDHWQKCSVCDYTTTPEAHTYGNTWQSDANNHWHACITCGAVTDRAAHTYVDGTCSVCGHKQPDPPSPPIHRHVWSSNWSSDAANHWIRCITCGAVKDRQAHIYDDDQDAVCNVCGYERTVEPPAHIHNWSEEWSSDSGHHWHECTAAGCALTDNSQKDGYGEHIYDDGQDAVCNVCGYERTVEPPAHIHSWSEEWSSDSGHHWHECTAAECDLTDNSQKDGYGEHVYDGDQDAVCNDCGYERTVEHRHSWSEGWSSDSGHHWHECTAAGCDLTDSSQKDGYGPHIFDNAWDAGCNTCGYQRLLPTPSRPSGGGSSIRAYAIKVEKSEHGKVTSSRAYAASGTTIALTVTPDAGCVLLELTVTDSQGNGISLTEKNTFTMPGRDVTVKASFAPVPVEPQEQPCGGGDGCPSGAYADLRTGAWYHEAVDYAIREGLLTGYGSGAFKPDDNLSRAQLAQILYNMAGRPVVKAGSRFADVAADSWCADAVAWAAAQGIIDGYGDGRFGPDDSITREQMAAMLWRYAGSPAATDKELHFSDAAQAGGWSLDALRWAVENGILHGNGDGTLAPKGLTSRAEAAQMLLNLADK